MLKRLKFPVGAFVVLMGATTLAPKNAGAGEFCNDKVCSGSGDGASCQPADNGPTTSCTGSGVNCKWDTCRAS